MKSSVVLLLILISAAVLHPAGHALAGQETRNGGNVIVMEDGKTYRLADLHFKTEESGRLSIDGTIQREIRGLWSGLHLILELGHLDSSGKDFFRHEVLGPYTEFRFTETLPEGCSFLQASELTLPRNAFLAPAGCTLEGVTYLKPSVYHQLPLRQQMLLLLHERMHAFNCSMALVHKMELIQAYEILLEKFFPAYRATVGSEAPEADTEFSLTDQELEILNRLSTRTRQLISATAPSRRATELTFTRDGGILRCRNVPGQTPLPLWQLDHENVRVHVGSTIEQGPFDGMIAYYSGGYGGSIRGSIQFRKAGWHFLGRVDISGVASTVSDVRVFGLLHTSREPLRVQLSGVQWLNVGLLLPEGLETLQIGGESSPMQTIDGHGRNYRPKQGRRALSVTTQSDWQKIMGGP